MSFTTSTRLLSASVYFALTSLSSPRRCSFPLIVEKMLEEGRDLNLRLITAVTQDGERGRAGGRITWNVHLLEEDHSSLLRLCVCARTHKCACVSVRITVCPGAVSLQYSLIHSISLFVGARVCGGGRQKRQGWRVITGTSCCSLIGHLLCHGAGPQPSYISWEGWRGPDTQTQTLTPLSATQSWQSDWKLEDPVQSVTAEFTNKP